ncbi:cysteine-rich KTR domain-containing protein [Clostridium sporogenes]|uniref:cysteine-rich KTR domain-containing protein n=1 Tax=Clostridium sporogenes TaxID=1509 RepID=UPI0013D8662B|nr:cysteine-rich KTR domain-containing protein [Clostridium sporogenes]EKS4343922.1 cysteine-rich KTR domain-containing protein [Clostridium botulinum]EKS4396190.1 cysteine-rich KTR domain-containing protein [Clostridium botulinum]MCF4015815.1 cysteine-rich KTR domain-containing protein [Clostridium sporogenes]MDU1419539.1 cysteine-rich KTR domain-containing protein [Clostridium botulinum]NFV13282.1 conjugal transfer protein [Clostridium sporogenes]
MLKANWLYCPICQSKTRVKVRTDTKLKNFLLFCPKCKKENLINVNELKMTVIKEPDAKTQSR